MSITLPPIWSSFILGAIFGWATVFLLAVWLYRQRDRDA